MVYMLPYSVWTRFKDNRQSALLQEVKNVILQRYPKTEMRGDGQVVVISFQNHQIEVLPVFELEDNSFKYPDTNNGGSWKITKPREEIKEISDFNSLNSNLRPLCKMARAWKNHHGIGMSGLLIDTLAYNFFKSTDYYNDKSYTYYDWMIRDFFKYLSELKYQNYYLAPGSNQKVYVKKKFQRKSKKAYNQVLEAIKVENTISVNAKWKKIFGRPFPSPTTVKTESYEDTFESWDNTEEFIEDKFNIDIRYDIKLDCEISQNGFRQDTLLNMLLKKIRLSPNKKLLFEIKEIDIPKPYTIYWKILNRGTIAKQKNQIRGQIINGNIKKEEKTTFRGEHLVECYIVKNNVVVAKDRIHVPISEG